MTPNTASQQQLDEAREAWERANAKLAKVGARAFLSRKQADVDANDLKAAQLAADEAREAYEGITDRFVNRDRVDQVATGMQAVREKLGEAAAQSSAIQPSRIDDMDGDTTFLIAIEGRVASAVPGEDPIRFAAEEVACLRRLVDERAGSGYAIRAQAILDRLRPVNGAEAPAAAEAAG